MPRIIAVLSGKGGVGKSSISVAVATIFSETHKTLLLDFDICGPSIATALGITGGLVKTEDGFKPLECKENLHVLSFGSILGPTDAVIWRGPKKLVFLDMFFKSARDYEYIVVDTPPGISEEHNFLASKGIETLIVTTPQNVSLNDTQRCIEFCLSRNIKVLGIMENMSSLKCVCCDEVFHPFGSKGGVQLADEYQIPFLCELPIEPEFTKLIDKGQILENYMDLKTFQIVRGVLNNLEHHQD